MVSLTCNFALRSLLFIIIELKIWRGDSEHKKAYEQLVGYLDSKNTDIGYLLTFNFRKDVNKVLKSECNSYSSIVSYVKEYQTYENNNFYTN